MAISDLLVPLARCFTPDYSKQLVMQQYLFDPEQKVICFCFPLVESILFSNKVNDKSLSFSLRRNHILCRAGSFDLPSTLAIGDFSPSSEEWLHLLLAATF